ncbi:MAG: hypothetical protein ACJ748_01055 [Flavisolibacter sp.]
MKKLAAILFVTVVFFNLYGYQFVIDFFQNKVESNFQSKLDNDGYNEQDLIYIKLPVNLPYYSNSSTYEKVSGSITVEGVEYRYVKRRIFNDSIELACVLNTQKEQFQSARNEFFKLSTDWLNTHPNKKSTSNIKIVPLSFCEKIYSYVIPGIIEQKQKCSVPLVLRLPTCFISVQEQPPNFRIS